MAKEIKNPSNIQIVTELCKQNPNSSYAKALKFDANTGKCATTDLSLFTDQPDIANEFISDMANKIIVQHTYDLFRGFEMPFSIFERAMSKLGDAEELLTAQLATTKAYSDGRGQGESTNPFDATKPTILLSWIKTEDKRVVDVALSYEIWAGAFVSEQGLSNIAGIILKNLRDAITLYVYDKIKEDLADEDKVTIEHEITAIEGAGETANAQKAYEEIIKLVTDMSLPTDDYNTSGVKTFTRLGDAVLVLNSQYKSAFDVNVLASLFNSAKIGENQYFAKVIVADLGEDVVGVVLDKEAYMFGYRFNVSQSIANPKNLEVCTYYHSWVKRALVPFRQAVRLVVAEEVTE